MVPDIAALRDLLHDLAFTNCGTKSVSIHQLKCGENLLYTFNSKENTAK